MGIMLAMRRTGGYLVWLSRWMGGILGGKLAKNEEFRVTLFRERVLLS